MSQFQFPSGQWVGFYTYARGSRKHLMDLILEFKNGVMKGEGADCIGLFVISGNYSAQSGECAWYSNVTNTNKLRVFKKLPSASKRTKRV
jgi:hypothetical protein